MNGDVYVDYVDGSEVKTGFERIKGWFWRFKGWVLRFKNFIVNHRGWILKSAASGAGVGIATGACTAIPIDTIPKMTKGAGVGAVSGGVVGGVVGLLASFQLQ